MSSSDNNLSSVLLKSGTNEVEFIEFHLGEVAYGVNVAKVQRVLARSSVSITKVDNSGSAVMGVIYVQGKPVLLIDLRTALDVPHDDRLDTERQLVLVTKFNKRVTAFLIDGVNKIHRTSWSNFDPISETLQDEQDGAYVTGTIRVEDKVILILDLEHLLLEFVDDEEIGQDIPTAEEESESLFQRRQKVRILYAEDSQIIRRMMLKTLKNGGYQNVVAFEHGQAAYEYIEDLQQKAQDPSQSCHDWLDCIITDIEMPRMDGLTLCKQIKANPKDADIPAVVVYSSLVNEEMTHKCKSVGADAQVSKPHGDEILKVLDQLCLKD